MFNTVPWRTLSATDSVQTASNGWGVQFHGDPGDFLPVFACSLLAFLIVTAVWSTRKTRRDAALNVIRAFLRWRY